jgi:hypothetical protein
MAHEALARATADERYVLADALESSAEQARSEASANRATMRKKKARVEPDERSGMAGTRLVIHVHAPASSQLPEGGGSGGGNELEVRHLPWKKAI